MQTPNHPSENIIQFLQSQKLITLATCDNNIPSCVLCFYSYDAEGNTLIFKSQRHTVHVQNGLRNRSVAGTIAPSSLKLTQILALQFRGTMEEPGKDELRAVKTIYYKNHPIALVMPGDLWLIRLDYIKLTNNKVKFSHKTEWTNLNKTIEHGKTLCRTL